MGYEHIHVQRDGDILVLRVLASKFWDDAVTSDLLRDLKELVTKEQPEKLVLDLSAVTYFSSLLVGILVALRKEVTAAGGTLHLCGVSAKFSDYLARISVDTLLRIFDSEEKAKAAF